MKNTIQLLLLFIITLSCAQVTKNKEQKLTTSKDKTIAEVVKNGSQEINTKIQFQDFTIIIEGLEAFDQNETLKQVQKDTATVYLEYGESVEGKKISIQSKLKDFEIYQRLENSITVADEGPHCDLTEWKHYDSEWKRLKNTSKVFMANTFSKEEKEKFISMTQEELLNGVNKYCEDKWVKFIKENASEHPSFYVKPSRIFLKIVPKNKNNKEKIICFILPMGC